MKDLDLRYVGVENVEHDALARLICRGILHLVDGNVNAGEVVTACRNVAETIMSLPRGCVNGRPVTTVCPKHGTPVHLEGEPGHESYVCDAAEESR